MVITNEKKEKLKYACCPICSKVLLQAESVKSCIIKCENCHRRIYVEIENDEVRTQKLSRDEG